MKFRVEIVNDRPMAAFDEEPSPRNWLLQFFLEDARTFEVDAYLEELDAALESDDIEEPTGVMGNHVDVMFFPDRVVIEELYPADDAREPAVTVLSVELARQLLLDWKKALNELEGE
jgi:hypothetical protein